jgi:20S proteasome alpha/beta subunit
MTAIIGFTCNDSVLMMADTEESTTYGKSSCDKLYHFASPSGYVLTGGAGAAHLIECANQELHTFFATGMPGTPDVPLTPQRVLDGLNIFAQKFFSETIEQYKAANLDPSLDFELLVAVNIPKNGTYLFRLYLNKVLWIAPPNHAVIGCGDSVIHPMLQEFQFGHPKETALYCGIRMMYHAKNTVQDVGGKTDAVALLNNGSMLFYGTANTALIEAQAIDLEKYLGNFVYTSVSNVSKEFAEIDESCEKSFQYVPEKLKEYRDKYRALLDNPIL